MSRTYSAFEIDGQRYERVEEIAHRRTNGTIALLTEWKTDCPDCGCTYLFRHPQRPAPFNPRRRCVGCAKPAKPVKTALSNKFTGTRKTRITALKHMVQPDKAPPPGEPARLVPHNRETQKTLATDK